jgi:hypothetical protein
MMQNHTRSKARLGGAVLATLVVTALAAFTVAPTAAAQPNTGITIPATCTVGVTPTDCTLQLIGFATQGGTLNAVFTLTNEVTGQVTRILVPVTTQPGTTCTILDLTIQPIDLFLLGLHLHTDTIHLVLTAQRGTLLGDLLCGLFFGPQQQLANLLNGALRTGQITLA